MSKILYPVGTKVTVKKLNDDKMYYFVVDYRKGKKFPYVLSVTEGGLPDSIGGTKFFSVKGLKRYNPTQAEVDQGNAPEQPESCAMQPY